MEPSIRPAVRPFFQARFWGPQQGVVNLFKNAYFYKGLRIVLIQLLTNAVRKGRIIIGVCVCVCVCVCMCLCVCLYACL